MVSFWLVLERYSRRSFARSFGHPRGDWRTWGTWGEHSSAAHDLPITTKTSLTPVYPTPDPQPDSSVLPSRLCKWAQPPSTTAHIMGGFLTLVEDRPTPKNVYGWRVYALAAVASFASCMIGYDSAFIGTTLALPAFVREFNFAELSDDELALTRSNIVSIYQAGAFFGSLFAYRKSISLSRLHAKLANAHQLWPTLSDASGVSWCLAHCSCLVLESCWLLPLIEDWVQSTLDVSLQVSASAQHPWSVAAWLVCFRNAS